MKVGSKLQEGVKIRDTSTGLSDAQYSLLAVTERVYHGEPCTVLQVQLWCDESSTPQCRVPTSCTAGYFMHASGICARCSPACPLGTELASPCTPLADIQCR